MKKLLIHWLGGVTKEESLKIYQNGKRQGKHYAAYYLVTYAISIYGVSAEEWCDKLFKRMNLFIGGDDLLEVDDKI